MEQQPKGENLSGGLSQRIKNELGNENLNNVDALAQTIKTVANGANDGLHLLLVGGMVRPEKQGKFHKDVDVVFYNPLLGTECFRGGDHKKFDEFADFFREISKKIGWGIKVEDPWFFDYEFCGDGKVVLSPNQGIPIEVLPVREDRVATSFEIYLGMEREPYEIIF